MKQKIQPPNNKIKEGNWNSEEQTNQIIISSNWVSNPLQKINATQVYIHRPNLQQTYQFNFLATISATLKKEAHIIHKYRGKSRLLKFILPPLKLARKHDSSSSWVQKVQVHLLGQNHQPLISWTTVAHWHQYFNHGSWSVVQKEQQQLGNCQNNLT